MLVDNSNCEGARESGTNFIISHAWTMAIRAEVSRSDASNATHHVTS